MGHHKKPTSYHTKSNVARLERRKQLFVGRKGDSQRKSIQDMKTRDGQKLKSGSDYSTMLKGKK